MDDYQRYLTDSAYSEATKRGLGIFVFMDTWMLLDENKVCIGMFKTRSEMVDLLAKIDSGLL